MWGMGERNSQGHHVEWWEGKIVVLCTPTLIRDVALIVYPNFLLCQSSYCHSYSPGQTYCYGADSKAVQEENAFLPAATFQ